MRWCFFFLNTNSAVPADFNLFQQQPVCGELQLPHMCTWGRTLSTMKTGTGPGPGPVPVKLSPPASCGCPLCPCRGHPGCRWPSPRGCSISRRSTAWHENRRSDLHVLTVQNIWRWAQGLPLFKVDEDLVKVLGTSVVDRLLDLQQ